MSGLRSPSSLVALALLPTLALGHARGELAEACDALALRHNFSGVLLVARGDERLAQRAYGWADVEAETPVRPETRFLVASLTKPVVAFLTLRLVEAELIGLEDTAAEHVDGLEGSAAAGATVHQLLTHTSGLPHYEAWPGFLDDVRREHSEPDLLALLAGTAPVSAPGAEFHYSGPGYLLLGILLERAASEPLPELLERWVLEPLGMRQTELLGTRSQASSCARPYVRAASGTRADSGTGADSGLVRAPLRHPSTLRATGGLVSTAADLQRFVRAIQRGQLLSTELHGKLLQGVRGQYACGLIVYHHPLTRERFARHQGSMDGVAAHFVFGLDDERVAIALSNVGGTPVDRIDDQLIMQVPPLPGEDTRGEGR